MSGLQVLLSTPPSPSSSTPKLAFIVPTLSRLLSNYPVTQVYAHLTSQAGPTGPWSSKETIAWESFVRCLVSLPGKLMNLTQGGTLYPVPAELDSPSVFRSLAIGVDEILWSRKDSQPGVGPLGFLVALLVRQGYASPSSISALSTALEYPANLFSVLLPRFLPRYDSSLSYATSWSRVLLDGATFSDQARLAESLLRHLLLGISTDSSVEAQCARAGQALQVLMGSSEPSLVEKVLLGVEAISLTGGEGSVESRAKMGVFWAGKKEKDEKALATLLFKVLDLWTDIQFIKFSLIAKHTYILTLFLLLLRSFPPQALALQRVASSPQFLNGLMHYLSHPDRSIRYLGMLGAEVVSELTVPPGAKKLDFGLWEGEEGHKILARRLRGLKMDWAAVDAVTDPSLGWQKTSTVATTPPHMPSLEPSVEAPPSSPKERKKARSKKPSTKIVVLSDSDDSLTGYHSSSSVSSTRSSSPTPSDLEEYVTDPTLYNAKKKKVPRPVYLSQLGELLGSRDDPEKLETGLKWGESLVRRKRGFGLELEENAVYIALMLAGLNDNFELDDFDNRKQGIMNALVACSPRKTAPALIEQYFHNQYSLQQRSAILTALAMGAREAAGMSTLATPTTASVDWPSKRLPPNLHQRYVSTTDGTPRAALGRVTPPCQIEHVASELSSMAIECSREDAESKIGEFQREKQVRVKRFAKAKPTAQVTSVPSAAELGIPEFKDVAAEFFIMPLINRFWLHYEEEDAKATRTSSSYTSTGAGMILSALALSKLLATMSVLVHAARHSPFFLTVIAPETLRLAMTTAGRLAASKRDSVDDGEVSVLGGALELSIVALDASRDLDDGRTLMVDHAGLILTVSEWGELVFAQTEKGERVLGEGGEAEGRVRRASAGLCVLVAGIRERWIRLVGFGS